MSDEIVTKRLHISGLTPAITVEDLSRRLSSFGHVKALDGFGQLDALGQSRRFGYITIEGTKGQLAKCVTVLSGSTWKGTKLRIGDAKQDFRERLQLEQETDLDPLKKKRKRLRGAFAEDMSLVDPSNASSRSGWKVTTMGRIVRPVKMRPEKPLPPQLHFAQTTRNRKDGKERKKVKNPDYRARRRMIDPTKWDSVHLKGMWLDVITAPKEREPMNSSVAEEEDSEDVSMDGPAHASGASSDVKSDDGVDEVDKSLSLQSESMPALPTPTPPQSPAPLKGGHPVQIKKLKDLFAPREEEGGFSLLGHLDLDLELGDEFDIPTFTESSVPVPAPGSKHQSSIIQIDPHPSQPQSREFAYDPSLPLFFPVPSSQIHLFPRQKDIATLARENVLSAGFYRTESEEEIRKKWEEEKGELTRAWKKRFREAGKMRRRRGGGDVDS